MPDPCPGDEPGVALVEDVRGGTALILVAVFAVYRPPVVVGNGGGALVGYDPEVKTLD